MTQENQTQEPSMPAKEAIDMMLRCKHEILLLRQINMRLEPKAEAYDAILAILRLLPQPSRGAGEDVVWNLDKRIESLKPKPDAASS